MERLGMRMLVFLLFIMQSAAHWFRQLGLQGQTHWRQRTTNILHLNWVPPHTLKQLTPYHHYNHMWGSCMHICLHGKRRNNLTFTYGILKKDFTLGNKGRFYIRKYFTAMGRCKLSEFVTRIVTLLTQSQISEFIMDNISAESESDWVTTTEEWGYEKGEVESVLKKDCALWQRRYKECSRAQVPYSLDLPGVPEDKNESLLQQ